LVSHINFCDNRFRNSSNIKDITSTVLVAVLLVILMREIFKCTIEMTSGVMIYMLSLTPTGSGIRVILRVLPQ
jgi:hypothetical protein